MQGQNLTLKPFLYIRSCSSYSLHSMHTKKISHRLRGLTQIFVYSRTSVNICGICGRTFISCLRSIRPQITRIHTDFSLLKNICEYLWNLRENIHILLERYSPTDYADLHRFLLTQEHLNICEICERIFIFCLKGILPQITL